MTPVSEAAPKALGSPVRAASERPGITLLTGFLGSGKTSLLRRVLPEVDASRIALIVNEIGEVGIDQRLLGAAEFDIALLAGACLCCATSDGLPGMIARLLDRVPEGGAAAFDHIIVETTGLADPVVILNGLAEETELLARVGPIRVVATLDAVHAADRLGNSREAARQLAVADVIVMTKGELARPQRREAAERAARALNPLAVLVDGSEPAGILAAHLFGTAAAAFGKAERLGGGAHHHAGVAAVHIASDRPVSLDALVMWLNALVDGYGDRLLRLKGIVHVAGVADPLEVHAVAGTLYPITPYRPDYDSPARSELTLIGEGLDAAGLAVAFDAIGERRLTSPPPQPAT